MITSPPSGSGSVSAPSPALAPLSSPRVPSPSVPVSVFSSLFCALLQYHQQRSVSVEDLESRLSAAGVSIGARVAELLSYRSLHPSATASLASALLHPDAGVRHNRIVPMLQYIHTTVWKYLFGYTGDGLERSADTVTVPGASGSEYYIYDKRPLTNLYVSQPRNMGSDFNAAALIAGCIQGMLEAAELQVAAAVTAHHTPAQGTGAGAGAGSGAISASTSAASGMSATTAASSSGIGVARTVYVIRFSKDTLARELQYKNAG